MPFVKGQPFKPKFDHPGGTIEFYIAGTSTPTPYYVDGAGTAGGRTAAIGLDGEPETDIFYDTSISYKMLVKDEDGNVVETVDNYDYFGGASALNTVADIRSGDLAGRKTIETLGYSTIGDGGAAMYYLDSSDTTTADDGYSCIVSNDGARFKLAARFSSENAVYSTNIGAQSGFDSTDAYQNWFDNNPQADVFVITEEVPTWKSINITRDNVTFIVVHKAQRVVENPIPIANRGMFMAEGRDNICIVGDFNLKGEGSRKIGEPGFEVNAYNTVAGRTGITGPANSAVYMLRCSNIDIKGSAMNTGESGYVLRNCGDVNMDVAVENCASAGVEFSFPDVDGSSANMPVRENYHVRIDGKYINDLKLGAGNGTTVSFAGGAVNEVFRNVNTEVHGYRNARETHQEFNSGARIEGFYHKVFSRDALQGCVATQGRNGKVEGIIINAGSAGAGAVNTGYPSLYGYIGSSGSEHVDVDLQVISTYDDGFTIGSDGSITAGSNVFTSASSNFPSSIVGKHICIEGANPSGAPLEAYVTVRNSATQITLDLNAQTSVSGATFGYGSGLRNPLIFNGAGEVDFDNSSIEGGVHSGLPGEPNAAAVFFGAGAGTSKARNMVIKAPSLAAGATAPAGIEIASGFGDELLESDNYISGFVENYRGFTETANVRFPTHLQVNQDALPNDTANTFGNLVELTPRSQTFVSINIVTVEFDSLAAETFTAELVFTFTDGTTTTQTLTSSSNQTITLSPSEIIALHKNNQKIASISLRSRSTITDSTARARLSFLGIEG